jgi:outer membrane receptor protein involved in Fe transport
MAPFTRARARESARALLLVVVASALGAPARGQGEVQAPGGNGVVVGRVFDAASGAPLEGVAVVLKAPPRPDGGEAREQTQLTRPDGGFEFGGVPPGSYSITFSKAGYRNSTMTDFAVQPDSIARADFPLPPLAAAGAAGGAAATTELEEFVVKAEKVEDLMSIRLESDALLNVVGVEEFSKFAAGDVAEVLERVAGVNIVEGQFAIIRGLEDRYSSTLYNGAPVPSPDPDRQSVQLDLFPSDVVGNLSVAKTFSPELPSNSSGGAIDIITHEYPEEVELKLKGGSGWNDNAQDRFLHLAGRTDVDRVLNGIKPIGTDPVTGLPIFPDINELKMDGYRFIGGNPAGREEEKTGNWFDDVLDDVIERDVVGSFGGRKEFGGREFRLKFVGSNEVDYASGFGFEETKEPRAPFIFDPPPVFGDFDVNCFCTPIIEDLPPFVQTSGDLSLGQLSLTEGEYELTVSQRESQNTAFAAFGFDLDDEGNHKLDASFFYTKKNEETVELKENGFLKNFDYAAAAQGQIDESFPMGLFDSVARGSFIGGAISARERQLDGPVKGALPFANFFESTSFERDRDLRVMQLNGDHTFDALPKLHVSWAMNRARTTQEDIALGMKGFFEPCGFANDVVLACPPGASPIAIPTEYPVSLEDLGPGRWVARNNLTLSANDVEEHSWFYRVDGDYELDLADQSRFTLGGGFWFERADRDVSAAFLETPTVPPDDDADPDPCNVATQQTFYCHGGTQLELGGLVFNELAFTNGNLAGIRLTENESSRSIDAWHARGKFTFWEKFDLYGGARVEKIEIQSVNDPFIVNPVTGEIEDFLGGPRTFPSRFLFFDRFDNPFVQHLPEGSIPNEVVQPPPIATVFNDQILGIGVDSGPCAGDDGTKGMLTCVDYRDRATLETLLNGRIDERVTLPSAGLAYRPFEGLVLRGAWSQTVARPSFREMGFYVSVEPGSDDLIVGNPQLKLSTVESYDGRIEYVWGTRGDLLALSYFKKTIERPIESIIIRDPIDATVSGSLYRTFFNNPDTADLWGAEFEARKSLDFFGSSAPDWLKYFSIGGNYTYIDAEVARTDAELVRSVAFFGTSEDDPDLFRELDQTRRLFNQPRWIVNADVTFDHPDWGLKATLAWFGISDVLDAAGAAAIGPPDANGMTPVLSITLDRYIDSYGELRATVSKTFKLPGPYGELVFRASAKNLTDSERRVVYDPFATAERITDREIHLGRDYDFSITYKRSF